MTTVQVQDLPLANYKGVAGGITGRIEASHRWHAGQFPYVTLALTLTDGSVVAIKESQKTLDAATAYIGTTVDALVEARQIVTVAKDKPNPQRAGTFYLNVTPTNALVPECPFTIVSTTSPVPPTPVTTPPVTTPAVAPPAPARVAPAPIPATPIPTTPDERLELYLRLAATALHSPVVADMLKQGVHVEYSINAVVFAAVGLR